MIGDELRCQSVGTVRLIRLLGSGTQGTVYLGEDRGGAKWAVKLFHARYLTTQTRRRIRFLLDLRLGAQCLAIAAPFDIIDTKDLLGHIAPYVGDQTLDEYLTSGDWGALDGLTICLVMARAIQIFHQAGLTFGDLHGGNVRIAKKAGLRETFLADLDNFLAPTSANVPSCPCVGHVLTIPPEIRLQLARRAPVQVSQETDLYAFGVLAHETLTLTHPAIGHDNSYQEMEEALAKGWPCDPATTADSPAARLPSSLCRMLRRALAGPADRPSASEWICNLLDATDRLACCASCDAEFFFENATRGCACGWTFPHLALRLVSGPGISLAGGTTIVGRDSIGVATVSKRHAIFRRRGPDTFVESVGQNGCFKWDAGQWQKLPHEQPVRVVKGDRLRFAQVEAVLC